MKKFMKILLVALMSVSLVACGGGSEEKEKTTFVVGMECNYAPFNWTTTEESDTTYPIDGGSGYADGYDVQVAKYIADELGLELVIKKIAWDGLQPALESGEIDAIIAGMTANEDRETGADFTTPYYESEMVMIVRSNSKWATASKLTDFSNSRVIGQINTNYDDIIDQIPDVNHMTPLKDYPSLIYALQQDTADAITAELPVATGACDANPDLAIVHFEEGYGFDIDTTVSIGLKEGTRDTDFFKNVQAALDKIDEATRLSWMSDATTRQPASE